MLRCAEKGWVRVLWRSVGDEYCREVWGRSVEQECCREVLGKNAVEKVEEECCVDFVVGGPQGRVVLCDSQRPREAAGFCIAAIFRSVMIFLDVPGPAADVTKLLAFLLLRLAAIDCEDAAAAASSVCEKGRRPLPI